jgi:hypothetical protein
MPAPVASGWSGRRAGLAPAGKRRLITAHVGTGYFGTTGQAVNTVGAGAVGSSANRSSGQALTQILGGQRRHFLHYPKLPLCISCSLCRVIISLKSLGYNKTCSPIFNNKILTKIAIGLNRTPVCCQRLLRFYYPSFSSVLIIMRFCLWCVFCTNSQMLEFPIALSGRSRQTWPISDYQ